jgi:hypothetical protein
MQRGVLLGLAGSAVLLSLAGCGQGFMSFQEREPWRREAEASCIKSGAVKQSEVVAAIKAIEGPGVCGADYPFKVAALGDSSALGYADSPRPPGAIPQGFPIQPARSAPLPRAYEPQPASAGPMSIRAPGTEPDEDEELELPDEKPGADPYGVPGNGGAPRGSHGAPARSYPSAQPAYRPQQRAYPDAERELPRLGPQRDHTPLGGPAAVTPAATLACPVISALDAWMANGVQPAAQRWFGQPVVEIKQISAYSCRGMNGQRGAPISEHAYGNALDIAAFTLADGRKVTVKGGWRGEPDEQGFLRDVHASACQQFSTVLAPGSNIYHYDHIHVDLARRRSGRQVCNPAAVSGEQIVGRRGQPWVTGSIGKRGGRMGYAEEDGTKAGKQLPRAIAGQD